MAPRKLLIPVMGALLPLNTFAQTQAPGWLEETMYHSGKINTVIAVVSVVLIGLGAWMFAMDRRIGRLEKKD
ncbi:MAG: hypothetical protein QM724_10150 [Flavobacteriales bacterium]